MEVVAVEAVEVLGGDELGGAGVVDEDVGAAEARLDQAGEAAAVGVGATSALTTSASAPARGTRSATASAGAASRE